MFSPSKWLNERKAHRTERQEERATQERRRNEERKIREREERRRLEYFRKQTFLVHVRERDGRRVAFESTLIDALLKRGAMVRPLKKEETKSLAADEFLFLGSETLALVGTAWVHQKTRAGYYKEGYWFESRAVLSGYWVPGHQVPETTIDTTYCDFRVISCNEQSEKVLVAWSGKSTNPDALADQAVSHIIASLLILDEATAIATK